MSRRPGSVTAVTRWAALDVASALVLLTTDAFGSDRVDVSGGSAARIGTDD